ncbi:hypothetical protein CAPTEDRAFT_74318, partial [Capitella teleta]
SYQSAHFGEGVGRIWLNDVDCTGDEDSIIQCAHANWGTGSCGHGEDIGVACREDGFLRLVNGASENEGRIEIFHSNQWGTICSKSFGQEEADVLCRSFGYYYLYVSLNSGSVPYQLLHFGDGSGPIWLDGVDCTGNENSIEQCTNLVWGTNDCGHDEDAGLLCIEHDTVRLVNGENEREGRVEIAHAGQWGTICDDHFGKQEADVICKSFGYSDGVVVARFGQGAGPIWLDDVACIGNEDSIAQCPHPAWGTHDCSHREDVGVVCSEYVFTKMLFRLVGGTNEHEGRVEVYHSGEWGTICDVGFGEDEADVICRSLGYSDGVSYQSAHFGEGVGRIWLNDVDCTGDEDSIIQCAHANWGTGSCGHGEDIGVACREYGFLRLVNGASENEGRIEIFHSSQWGTICSKSFGQEEADVLCRSFGY